MTIIVETADYTIRTCNMAGGRSRRSFYQATPARYRYELPFSNCAFHFPTLELAKAAAGELVKIRAAPHPTRPGKLPLSDPPDNYNRWDERDGHYVTVAPSDEYRRAIFGTADNIWPRLIIRAGYDGRAFRAQLGFYRDACRNLAMLRSIGRETVANIRHTHHLRERLSELQQRFANWPRAGMVRWRLPNAWKRSK